MKILIVDCGSSKVPAIISMLKSFNVETETILLENTGDIFCDGIVISGAPVLLTEKNPDTYLKYIKFINDFNKPVLGICFGHQLIGLYHGSKISRCQEDRGWQNINIMKSTPITDGFKNEMQFKEDHCECITLPSGFELLASSSVCKNEMMKHPSRNIFGVQFHPEVSEENGKLLFRNFTELCKNKLP